MSKKLVRWTARAVVAGCLVAATVVVGSGVSAPGNFGLPPTNGNQGNSNSWIGG